MLRLLLVAALACGCSGASPGDVDLGGADLSSAAGADLAGPPTTLHHISTSWSIGGTAAAGASVCVVEYPQLACAFADDNGLAVVQAPDHQNVTLRYTLAGAYPMQQVVATLDHDLDLGNINLATNISWDQFFVALGLTRDPAKGDLIVSLRRPGDDGGPATGLAGANVALVPSSGTVTYTLDDGSPSTAQAVTTSAGHLRVFNVDPGVLELFVTAAGHTCTAAFGWSGGDNKLGVRIDPSVRTVASAACD